MRILIAAAIAIGAIGFPPVAAACSWPAYVEDRYVGGDLTEQIARKAEVIQIVRAVRRHILSRSYSAGANFLHFGEAQASNQPEHTDTFVVEFEVLETLKGAEHARNEFYDQSLRTLAYGAAELIQFSRSRDPPVWVGQIGPAIPEQVLDRPGSYMFGTAATPAGSETNCNQPYYVDIGQTFIALRNSMGRFYPSELQGTGLHIDVEYRLSDSTRRERSHFTMQSLILIQGEDDPFLVRLHAALTASQNGNGARRSLQN